ncbi:MAG: NADH-quinone oxidoreductase subunit C [Nevskia sp.]|nr:NADH-quinone oxidoreductase subunit C [Nevskia sp.]
MRPQQQQQPEAIRGAVPARRIGVPAEQWLHTVALLREAEARLLALWASDERDRNGDFAIYAALLKPSRLVLLELRVPAQAPVFPSIAALYPGAVRMERAVHDLFGVRAEGDDTRPWLRHGAWPAQQFPLRREFQAGAQFPPEPDSYPFVRVEGDGVHEIAVGPVHAGIIEPGHFRFSVVGEKLLRLEERLGYVHKGIEKRFEQLSLEQGVRLAARVSGDSAAAFSWAYCMALEGMGAAEAPPRALFLRALLLERERLANHLGDLGALGNDAGFAFGLSQFSRLKEDLLRLNAAVFGARYPMDFIVPGGVAGDLSAASALQLLQQGEQLQREVGELRRIYDEHAGVQDRFGGCGKVAPALARQLGLMGFAGRASGTTRDLRNDLAIPPYDRLSLKTAGRTEGDVAARVAVRFDEVIESLRLCRKILQELPDAPVRAALTPVAEGECSIGLIEGWRGPVFVALEAGPGGSVRRCHPHDCSWQNWPVLEHAVIGNIVPDFPLINKSFNLSYSGQDL